MQIEPAADDREGRAPRDGLDDVHGSGRRLRGRLWLAELGDRQPYFYAFKRILFVAQLPTG